MSGGAESACVYVLGVKESSENVVLEAELPSGWNYQFDGSPLAASWSPPRVRVMRVKGRGEDFCRFYYNLPVVSGSARSVLEPVLGGAVEFLPLECPGRELFAMNVLLLVDALDEERATLRRDSNGFILEIRRYAFHVDRIAGLRIFKLAGFGVGRVLVTEEFKALVVANKLRGAVFSPV